jgi:hypothetical protein
VDATPQPLFARPIPTTSPSSKVTIEEDGEYILLGYALALIAYLPYALIADALAKSRRAFWRGR